MDTEKGPLDRASATEYASWFKALADATRIQIVSLLARSGRPMTVGEIVDAVDVGQSTVSAHLKVLAEVRFVLADRRGTSAHYRINEACVDCFPSAADLVMGRPVPAPPTADAGDGLHSAIVQATKPVEIIDPEPGETCWLGKHDPQFRDDYPPAFPDE